MRIEDGMEDDDWRRGWEERRGERDGGWMRIGWR
jgi:hypothetical protein